MTMTKPDRLLTDAVVLHDLMLQLIVKADYQDKAVVDSALAWFEQSCREERLPLTGKAMRALVEAIRSED
jgi:hypothetical protein